MQRLIKFVEALEMGSFYAGEILTKSPCQRRHGVVRLEAGNLYSCKDDIYKLVMELLRYQPWRREQKSIFED